MITPFDVRKDFNTIKTYCKNVCLDKEFIKQSVLECLDGKWNRYDVKHMLSGYSEMSFRQIKNYFKKNDISPIVDFDSEINRITDEIYNSIKTRGIALPPIKYYDRYDDNSKKTRTIGVQKVIHQCYEYVAVNAAKELFYKKIGQYQCASIPGRGQSYGKKTIEKWLRLDEAGTKYVWKADIKHCYPSIDKNILKGFLHRDLHKNPDLLYLLDTLIDQFDTGLSIGSHLSQWLCNYYLSYAYHYISEQLFKERKSRRGSQETKKVRLITHQLFYMDDIILFSNNKKYLNIASKMVIKYFNDALHLTIKGNHILFKVDYIPEEIVGEDGRANNNAIHKYTKEQRAQSRGAFVDMMGFRFYRNKTTIRNSIFKKLRRKVFKLIKKIRSGKTISFKFAQSFMSYWGWLKNTNSFKFSKSVNIKWLVKRAGKIISAHTKYIKYIKDRKRRSAVYGTPAFA